MLRGSYWNFSCVTNNQFVKFVSIPSCSLQKRKGNVQCPMLCMILRRYFREMQRVAVAQLFHY